METSTAYKQNNYQYPYKQKVALFAPVSTPSVSTSNQWCIRCQGENAFYFCQHHIKGNHFCGKQLCRACVHFGANGMDYCKQHLPVASTLGTITVGNIYHYKNFNAGEYIGRKTVKDWGYHLGSALANPRYINIQTATEEEKEANLNNYKSILKVDMRLKGAMWRDLVRLRDLVLAGKPVLLLCWCKDKQGQGKCHGDIVKAAIEAMAAKIIQNNI